MIQLLISFFGILIFVWMAGKFDYIMDMIKDYQKSPKNWLWILCSGTKYELWYIGHVPLPFFEKRGYKYTPGNILLGDAWHQTKHLMMLSFTGAIALTFVSMIVVAFNLFWYWQVLITVILWWFFYWLEGEAFSDYQKLK